ncbi:MAG: ABC transporter ATP-binding protein [Epsilonproteobacteria bacterium]|nr:ABC transporter ATP-binding protein [Campylobacterota bacterium]
MAILKTEKIIKKFGGLVAVKNMDFEVNEKEIVGIIGANGAGKTTFFNCISGNLEPTSGRIIFDGHNITKYKPYQIAKLGLARTFQVVKPFANKTVLYNVTVGAFVKTQHKKDAIEKAEETINFLNIYEKKNVLAKNLTLPERKRLELARALATRPKLLLLDEVMAGLRPDEIKDMLKIIEKINNHGVTIVIIEHIMQVIMSVSKRIYAMNFGEKIACGTPEEVAKNKNVIKAYLGDEYVIS